MQPISSQSDTAPRSRAWRAGAVIGGRYRLIGPIGAGAMGEVWRAEHATLGTPLAVKLVDTANRRDAGELLARFQQEARAAAQLRSPHVVQILDHGADQRVAFIAMELLEGESLEQRLERRGHLAPSEAAHVLREMARGIDRAHAAGIVHRDLKPPNVFIARVDGVEVVKVLDFGIAKFLGVPREAQLQTQAGFVVGTPAYMSPEQVLAQTIDRRSDLWQLAIITFECVTGRRPFDGESLGQLFMAICSAPMPIPSAVLLASRAPVPPMLASFDAWFARAAHRDPAQRFGSASEMAEALGAIFAPGAAGESAIPTIASSQRIVPAVATRSEATPRARGMASSAPFFAGLALAPLLAATAGGLYWWRSHRQPVSAGISAATTTAAAIPPAASSTATVTSAATTASSPTASASAAPRPAPAISARPRSVPRPDRDRLGL